MHEDPAARNRPPEHAAFVAGHEVSDLPLGGVKVFLVILFGTIGITLVLMMGLAWGYSRYQQSQEEPQSPMVTAVPEKPEPALQPSRYHNTMDWVDLKALHEEEDAKLGTNAYAGKSYAWIGDQKQTARIPIGRAMDLMLAKGFTARTGDVTGNNLTPVPTGGAAGIINNAANPLDHAPPMPRNVSEGPQ